MARPLKPFGEWDWEVREAVKTALALVEGKNGFKTHSEIWRRCNLVITVGHNIYTTSIEIRPPEQDVIRRRSNWHKMCIRDRTGDYLSRNAGINSYKESF